MKKAILSLLIMAMLLSPLVMAQGDNDSGSGEPIQEQKETPEEQKLRMLLAFNEENVIPGYIIVSFSEGTTKTQAQSVLGSFGLSISKSEICSGAGGPNENSKPKCETLDNWVEGISVANVKITKGQEKQTAQLLIKHSQIDWIEPDYASIVLNDSGPSPENFTKETPEQKKQRMLEAFDEQIAKGSIIVSFSEDIDKAKAQGILSSYGLRMSRSIICSMGSAGQNCETKDNWFSGLSAAVVTVQEGLEKKTAEQIYSHANVNWVEPDLVFGPAVPNNKNNIQQLPAGSQDTQSMLMLVVGIVVAAVIITVIKKR